MAAKKVLTKKQTHPPTSEDRLTKAAAQTLADYAHRPSGWMESVDQLAGYLKNLRETPH